MASSHRVLPRVVALTLVAACGGVSRATPAHAPPSPSAHASHEHAAHTHEHAGHGDRVPHAHHSAREYAAMLEEPSRLEWQQPARLIETLGVRAGMHVADLGTGSGYFLPWLDRAVAPTGVVVAEDIDDALLDLVRERTQREGLARVEVRRGQPNDPALEPGRYDLVLLVDTYHHIEDRPGFLAHVRRALVPGQGRFVVVDFRPGELPLGPRPEHKIPPEQVEREVTAAGMPLVGREDFLRYQFVQIFGAPAR